MAIGLIEVYQMEGKIIPGNEFAIPEKKIVLGRTEQSDIFLRDAQYQLKDIELNRIRDLLLRPVSGRHCEVEAIPSDGNGSYLQVNDVSRHGTFIFPGCFSGHQDELPDRIPSFDEDKGIALHSTLDSTSGIAEVGSVLGLGPVFFLGVRLYEPQDEVERQEKVRKSGWRGD